MTPEPIPLDDVLGTPAFPPGRRIFALRAAREVAADLQHEALVAAIDAAIAHDTRATLPARQAYVHAREGVTTNPALVALDNVADRLVAAIDSDLKHIARSFRDANPLKADAIALREAVLPRGAAHITTQPLVEQHAELQQLVAALVGPQHEVAQRLGLGPKVAELEALTADYGAQLQRPASDALPMTFVRYREIDQHGQSLMLAVLARILGLYPDDDAPEADLAARADLLAPILEQQAQIRAHNRRSRARVPDIDPDTGVAPPAPNDDADDITLDA